MAAPTPRQLAKQLVEQMIQQAVDTYSESGGLMQVTGGEIRVQADDASIQVVMNPLETGTDTESAVQGEWQAEVVITRGSGQQRFNVPTEWLRQPTVP
jgi:hypothetical protein